MPPPTGGRWRSRWRVRPACRARNRRCGCGGRRCPRWSRGQAASPCAGRDSCGSPEPSSRRLTRQRQCEARHHAARRRLVRIEIAIGKDHTHRPASCCLLPFQTSIATAPPVRQGSQRHGSHTLRANRLTLLAHGCISRTRPPSPEEERKTTPIAVLEPFRAHGITSMIFMANFGWRGQPCRKKRH